MCIRFNQQGCQKKTRNLEYPGKTWNLTIQAKKPGKT